jgi:hypothetical protein
MPRWESVARSTGCFRFGGIEGRAPDAERPSEARPRFAAGFAGADMLLIDSA